VSCGPGRWDPAASGAGSVELGPHDDVVLTVAVMADGRLVTGDERRMLIWTPAKASTQFVQLSCSLIALATAPFGPATSNLVIAHKGSGFSLWSFTA
jgi:hypothetical protein